MAPRGSYSKARLRLKVSRNGWLWWAALGWPGRVAQSSLELRVVSSQRS
jgi:hypothetical protein